MFRLIPCIHILLRRCHGNSIALATAMGVAVLLAPPGPARADPFFMGLGDLPGGDFSSGAIGVSADGSTVVGQSTGASDLEAFRWTAGGGMLGLGHLPDGTLPGSLSFSQAIGVSAHGSVVVGQSRSVRASSNEAFRWTARPGMVGLGDLPGGLFFSQASGVSADGSVVVGNSPSTSGAEAFRWTSGGGMVGLGDLPGGIFQSFGLGVSADGSVVVGTGTSALGTETFRWTSGGGMVALGDLAGGSFFSQPFGVSADGSTVVGFGFGNSGREAFRWTQGGGMLGLGDLAGGIFDSQANDASADGSVVVGLGNSASVGKEATLWTAGGGMRSLQDMLTTDFGLGPDLAGWRLFSASSISDDGLTIVGAGLNPTGQTEAFIASIAPAQAADIPEPAALALLGFGLAGLGFARRRRTALHVPGWVSRKFPG